MAHNITSQIRLASSCGVLAVALLFSSALTGCSAVQLSPPISSCKNCRQNSDFGKFNIQQKKKGSAIQWGAYPSHTYSGVRYTVNVYTGSKRYDAKDQGYAPHGSIAAATAKKYSGQNLRISGKVFKLTNDGYKAVLVYNMVCKIL
ncbi:MAG: hypothetical protein QM606_03200 [Leucobacter sp.]